jgi:hypothetical protein
VGGAVFRGVIGESTVRGMERAENVDKIVR